MKYGIFDYLSCGARNQRRRFLPVAISAVGFYRYIWFISIGYGFSIAGIGAALLIYFGITGGLTAVSIVMAALLIVYGHRYIWFISIGYGFSIAGIGAALLIYFGITGGLTAVSIVMAALLIVYGLRLGGYLLAREYRSSSYHQVMQQAIDNGKHVKLPLKLLTWVGLIVYGLRLGGYLLAREYRSSSYHQVMQQAIDNGKHVKLPLKLLTWVGCALLYACEASPIAFRLQNHAGTDAVAIVGAAIMGAGILLESAADLTKNRFKQQHPHRFCDVGLFRLVRCPNYLIVGAAIMGAGILLESAADLTKNRFKQQHPHRFCDVGLFRLVRCPNYLGEIVMWTGVFVSGVTILSGAWQWIAAIGGYLCICWIMFGGARRLELRQNKE